MRQQQSERQGVKAENVTTNVLEVLHSGEAARRLGVAVPTAITWAKRGIIKARRSADGVWLFDEISVELAAGRESTRIK